MGGIALEGVTKRFGDVVAVDDLSLEIEDREFLVLLGPSGCGKSHGAADDRRARGSDRRDHPHRRPGRQRRRAQGPRHRDGVPVVRALPAHDGAGEHRVPAQVARRRRRASGRAWSHEAAASLGLDRAARPQARAALGRAAPAGRARTRDRPASAGVPDGRAALEPRREAPGADARRAHRAPASPRGHDRRTSPTTRSRR